MSDKIFVSAVALASAVMFVSPVWSEGMGRQGAERSQEWRGAESGRQMEPGQQTEVPEIQKGAQRITQDQVRVVQEALKDKGYDPGPVDGILGPQTNQAIREFQRDEGIQVTGTLDAKTQEHLGIDQTEFLYPEKPSRGETEAVRPNPGQRPESERPGQ